MMPDFDGDATGMNFEKSTYPCFGLLLVVIALAAAHRGDAQSGGGHALFIESERCIACHSNISAPNGADISIGYDWRTTMMALSARDPYWIASVRREVMDHPSAQAAIEDKCTTCHMPIGRTLAVAQGSTGKAFATIELAKQDPAAAHLALDGVSCTLCHQIEGDNFGKHESYDGGYRIDLSPAPDGREVYGPYAVDTGRVRAMHSSTENFVPVQSTHIQQSELCATCHTLFTDALTADGKPAGELPEQMPYFEWLASRYASTRSCQNCHMPEVGSDAPISSTLGQNRPNVSRHVFVGGNAYMLRLMNKYRADLGVVAPVKDLDASAARTAQFLQSETAKLKIHDPARSGSTFSFAVEVINLSGHKFPTAYPSRRAWLHVRITDAAGSVLFESGRLRPDGSIIGNDNDADGTRFEPHHAAIEQADQVQIYEDIMVDSEGVPTTGLLRGVRYIKDNRLLPAGMVKAQASKDIAVRGEAESDADFDGGGDRVLYRIETGNARGPIKVEAHLLFQTIGYRWAQNLRSYDAAEPRRFIGYFEATAQTSAEQVASATVTFR